MECSLYHSSTSLDLSTARFFTRWAADISSRFLIRPAYSLHCAVRLHSILRQGLMSSCVQCSHNIAPLLQFWLVSASSQIMKYDFTKSSIFCHTCQLETYRPLFHRYSSHPICTSSACTLSKRHGVRRQLCQLACSERPRWSSGQNLLHPRWSS